MKVLYLADNSDLPNWGCRATSMALRQLIARDHEIVGTVPGRMIEAHYPLSDVVGDRAYAMLSRLFNRERVRRAPLVGPLVRGAMDGLGQRNALSHDLDSNIRTLERARAYRPEIQAMFAALEACDAVVVNGEGDLIFSTPARARLLFTLTVCALALRRGKTLYYLNAMASECPTTGVNMETVALAAGVLGAAEAFTVRDPASQAFVQAHMPGVATRTFPDALFHWSRTVYPADYPARPDFSALQPAFHLAPVDIPDALRGPYAMIGGGSRAARDWPAATAAYVRLVDEMRSLDLPLLLAPCCGGDLFMQDVSRLTGVAMLPVETPILAVGAVLANARVFVSGRWHPSIMASLGGTPSVFFGSNSHKTLTIQQMLDYPDPHEFGAIPTAAEARAAAREAAALVAGGDALRARILATSRRLAAQVDGLASVIGAVRQPAPPLAAREAVAR